MPKVQTVTLSNPERDALAAAVQRYGTYPDTATDLGIGIRSLEYWLQETNRRPIPQRRLEALLLVIFRVRPEESDRLKWVLKGEARNCLQHAESAAERERMSEQLAAMAGVSAERPPIGPNEARERGHVGMAKAGGQK